MPATEQAAEAVGQPQATRQAPVRIAASLVPRLSYRNIGAVYVWLAIVAVFAVWVPETFLTATTVKQVFNNNAVAALAALAIVIPLCAGVFDLSVGFVMSLTGVTAAHFVAEAGIGVVPAVAIALCVGLGIGLINALIVVRMRIDSFIATLATGSLIQSLITLLTDDTSITGVKLAGSFAGIGQSDLAGVTLPVFYVLGAAFAIWFLLEHTSTGRRLYATGFNREAARLAGIRTERLRFGSLVASGGLAGVAGITLASVLGTGSPTAGASYLLTAFAAAFVGATQFKAGRFNAWGTLLAVVLLGTGITGLGLAAAPNWSASMFTGAVLLAALSAASAQRRNVRRGRWWRSPSIGTRRRHGAQS
jgi:ribose/xylose/arabinose/galactoside ABC-type transport system permease subunit